MKKEQNYDFRKKLLTVHTPGMVDPNVEIPANAAVLTDGVVVEIGNTDDVVIRTAAEDFVDYLQVSMGLKARLSTAGTSKGANTVRRKRGLPVQISPRKPERNDKGMLPRYKARMPTFLPSAYGYRKNCINSVSVNNMRW